MDARDSEMNDSDVDTTDISPQERVDLQQVVHASYDVLI